MHFTLLSSFSGSISNGERKKNQDRFERKKENELHGFQPDWCVHPKLEYQSVRLLAIPYSK